MRRRLLLAVLVSIGLIGVMCGQVPQRVLLWSGAVRAGRSPLDNEVSSMRPIQARVMTLNVLCSLCRKEGYDDWSARLPHLRGLLERHQPDLVGVQELLSTHQAEALLNGDAAYAVLSFHARYADSAVLYLRDRFEVRDSGEIWMSPTPLLPLSLGWQRLSLPRYAIWAILKDLRSGERLLFATVHLDNNTKNRQPSARRVRDMLAPMARRLPTIIAGDFNTRAREPRFAVLSEGLYDAQEITEDVEFIGQIEDVAHTRRELQPEQAIDHILVGGPRMPTVDTWIHDASVYGQPARRPSDHPAIIADVSFE